MKMSKGLREEGIVVGNTYDKYSSTNPVVRKIMRGFDEALSEFVSRVAPKAIHEIGCGEGYWVMHWKNQGINARGSDFSLQVIKLAHENATECGLPPEIFKQLSIYDADATKDSAELIVCCEVMEHLENPEEGLQALQRITEKHIILSVPREPIWRALNMLRGKYWFHFGNTPGHIQHWSRSGFEKLVSKYFDIIGVKTPFPWTMLLCRAKQ